MTDEIANYTNSWFQLAEFNVFVGLVCLVDRAWADDHGLDIQCVEERCFRSKRDRLRGTAGRRSQGSCQLLSFIGKRRHWFVEKLQFVDESRLAE